VPEDFQGSGERPSNPFLTSPTLVFSLILIAVYIAIGILGGDLVNPLLPLALAQCDSPLPIYPWTLVTSIFLHAGIIHIASNVLFLLIFGFILEEQVTKTRWVTTFFLTGVAGNLTFVGADLAGFFLNGVPNMNPPELWSRRLRGGLWHNGSSSRNSRRYFDHIHCWFGLVRWRRFLRTYRGAHYRASSPKVLEL